MAKKPGKNITKARGTIEARPYKLVEAAEAIKKAHFVKFNETVELVANLGVDPKQSEPDMMRSAGRLGKVLGPRGLMPNPKTGTVTFEVAQAVKEIKAGKVEFRVDKQGIVHSAIGKISFDAVKLAENAHALIGAILKAKPSAAKGKFVKKVTLTSTMGPGVTIDESEVESAVAAAA